MTIDVRDWQHLLWTASSRRTPGPAAGRLVKVGQRTDCAGANRQEAALQVAMMPLRAMAMRLLATLLAAPAHESSQLAAAYSGQRNISRGQLAANKVCTWCTLPVLGYCIRIRIQYCSTCTCTCTLAPTGVRMQRARRVNQTPT